MNTCTMFSIAYVFVGRGIDYTAVLINVTFLAGTTSQFFDVPLINDTVLEPTEQFIVEIKAIYLIEQPVPPVIIGSNTVATGTILDDDGKLLLCF